MGVEAGIPETIGEFEEFGRKRFVSGLDQKEGTAVFVISGSVVGGGGTGGGDPTTIRSGLISNLLSGSVVAQISGQPVRVSGETVIAKVSGETIIAKVSGETVLASISGQPVVLAVSGPRYPSAGSGLDPSTYPLHVMVVSGSLLGSTSVSVSSGLAVLISGQTVLAQVSGQPVVFAVSGPRYPSAGSGLDPSTTPLHVMVVSGSLLGSTSVAVSSGLAVLVSGQAVSTLISGQPVGISGATVIAKVSGETLSVSVSGNVVVVQSGAPINISGQYVDTRVSGQPVVLAVSGPRYPSAGSGLDPSTYPLHVMVVSGSLLGSTSVSVSSGLAVLISGQAVSTLVSGQPVSVSGQTIYLAASGMGPITARSGSLDPNMNPLHVLVVSGSVTAQTTVVGATSVTTLSGSLTSISGETVIARVSGQTVVVSVSGQTIVAQVSGQTLVVSISGNVVVVQSGAPINISGQTVATSVSGQPVGVSGATVYLAVSGMGPITSRSGTLEPTFNPLHVLVISGSVAGTGGGDPTTIRSGLISNLLSGSVVTASGSVTDVVDRIARNVGVVAQYGEIESLVDSETNTPTMPNTFGGVVLAEKSYPLVFNSGSSWDRLRGWSGANAGGWVGLLAVGIVSGANVVRMSGETVIARVSGEVVVAQISGQTVVVSISGNVVVLQSGAFLTISGQAVATSISGQPVGVSGATVIAKVSGETLSVSISGNVVVVQSGAPLTISGQTVATSVSGQPVGISGATVIAKVSGETVVAQVSGQTLVVSVSGNVVVVQSGAPINISGQAVATSVSGQPVGISGATVVVSVSGQTIVAGISGQTVVVSVSGNVVELAASGMGRITSKSGSLEPTFNPLHVLVISGSVAGTGGGDPTSVRSGTIALYASGMGLITAKSGSLDPNVIPLHVLVISGSVAGTGGGDPTTIRSGLISNLLSGSVDARISGQPVGISGQTVIAKVSGETLSVSVSGNVLEQMFSGYGRARDMLGVSGVNVLSGNVPGVQAVGFVSGYNTVVLSGQTVIALVSGQAIGVSGQTVVVSVSGQTVVAKISGETLVVSVSGQVLSVSVSGNVVEPMFSGYGRWREMLGLSGANVLSGNVPGVQAVGFVSGYNTVVLSGQTVIALVSGQAIGVSGQTVVVSVSGQLVYLGTSGMPGITSRSGTLVPASVPLHVLSISGGVVQAVLRDIPTAPADGTNIPGPTAFLPAASDGTNALIFQETILNFGGGDLWDRGRNLRAFGLLSGLPLAVGFASGWYDRVRVSGETVYPAASGMGPITSKSGSLEPTFNPLHVLVVSGSVVTPVNVTVSGFENVTTRSGSVTSISGETVIARVSGETVVTSMSGNVVVVQSGAPINISGQFTPTSVSGQPVGVSGATVYLAVSGMGPITSRSGTLEPTFNPLHVLVISGSVAGTGGGDPTSVRSGTIALYASGMGLFTGKSGALDPNTIPLHVLVVSGSIAGSTSVSVSSGLAVLISGQAVSTLVSGQPVAVSGNVVEGMFSGYGRWREMLGVSGANVLSGNVPGVLAVGFVSGYNRVVISGQTVDARISGQTVRISDTAGVALPMATEATLLITPIGIVAVGWEPGSTTLRALRVDGAGALLATVSGNNVVAAGLSNVVARISGQTIVVSVSGQTVVADISGEAVLISGQSVYAGIHYPLSGLANLLPASGAEGMIYTLGSGQGTPLRTDEDGMAIVRVGRIHFSGFYARTVVGEATSGGDTAITGAGSGRALRIKALHDAYQGFSGTVVVGYRFSSGLLYTHQLGASVPNWGMNLVGGLFQGGGAEILRLNLRGVGSGAPNFGSGLGVYFTATVEEVGSGDIF